ncbi:uncharacterized protein BDR25DRAFT_308091 [Lindgomyces ingoldianus]|uniref:Uncharacterized protein n=1 Tax=Lindgomyces ingoldianus TaxID=673940 RepID=A0ACB6Q9R9_9PLEO|nr:uncharacterized protein BDR25DRAFT_308091 [Lindgomyces ingoldianus]KAF2462891.1 hypothetical protein BDR25DRAFT_308091 [Lindgomyces ingoldianus]
MDPFSTSLEIISLVYETTIFIRDVTAEVKNYGDAKRDISERLEHELVFVETFTDVCFGEDQGLLRDPRVKDSVKRDVKHCLDALSRASAEYRVEAEKYKGTVPDIADETADALAKTDLKDGRKGVKDRMKARCEVWKKKAAPLEWALFGKEEMENLLATYTQWTDRLRQTLSIVLLLAGTPSPEFAASAQAANLGMKEVSERQVRVRGTPPEEYDALKGEMKDEITTNPGNGLIKGVYEDESGFDSIDVVVEIRPYDEALSLVLSERNYEATQALKEPLRQLTWLLQSPVDSNFSREDAEDGYRMHTLGCIGFLDEPSKNRSLILYRSPSVPSTAQGVPTLHNIICKAAKPSLGNRFRTARALASTLLTIHASSWVHKNICSRSILMLPVSSTDSENLPYLLGWDVARPLEAGTSLHGMFDLEPNLYRHQARFGKPFQKFSNEHDIYSLGVVLLEIGLWKTMSTIFARPLEKHPRIKTTEQHDLFRRVNGMIIDLANSPDLKREMGEGYAAIVRRCLAWETSGTHEDAVEHLISFRKTVVDALSPGSKL